MKTSFGVRRSAPLPLPPFSRPSFYCSLLSLFLGRSPAENREALNKRGERLFCCTLIVRVVSGSASLFSCLTPACCWEYMLKWVSAVWWATFLTSNQSSKVILCKTRLLHFVKNDLVKLAASKQWCFEWLSSNLVLESKHSSQLV